MTNLLLMEIIAMYSNRVLIIAIYLYFMPSKTVLSHNHPRFPIILVPGLFGSRLEAQLNKNKTVNIICKKNTHGHYEPLWIDYKQLLPVELPCLVDNLKLNYNTFNNKTFNQPGVLIRVPCFGNPETIEYLSRKCPILLRYGYMNFLVRELLKVGYKRQKNLFAAPYDFRKGPSELTSFFNDLHKLIKKAYKNNNAPVIFITHSMGGLLIFNFLQNKTKKWKKKYIRAIITLATPFGGNMKALKVFIAGEDMDSIFLDPLTVREALSTMPSFTYLLPTKQVWGDSVLVSTSKKIYKIDDLKQLFHDIGNPNGWKMYLNERKFSGVLSPPGVELHCFQGSGLKTIKKLAYYTKKSFPSDPTLFYEIGDGTVGLRSIQYCQKWITEQQETVETKSFLGINHLGILKNERALQYIINTVKNISNS